MEMRTWPGGRDWAMVLSNGFYGGSTAKKG